MSSSLEEDAPSGAPQPYLQRQDMAMQQLFNLSHDLLGIAGFDGYFKQVNPSWSRTLGWTDAEVLGRPYLELIHPDDRSVTAAEAGGLAEGVTTLTFENRYRCSDGSFRWISWTATPSEAEGLIYCAGRDVTLLKRASQISDARLAAGQVGSIATTWPQAAPSILRGICDALGMDVGEVWRARQPRGGLGWEMSWSRPRKTLARFMRLGRDGAQGPGIDLVDEAFRAGAPVIIPDIGTHPGPAVARLAEARRQGLRGGLAFPLHGEGGISGAMAFFGTEVMHLDDQLSASLSELGTMVSGVMARLSVDEDVRRRAYFDGLTGLPNRTLFFDRVEQAIEQARRSHRWAHVLVLDLDGFKAVNDAYGHAAGDEVLRQASKRMESCLRTSDTVARLGGDEFGVVGVTESGPKGSAVLANKLTRALAATFLVEGMTLGLKGSIGGTTIGTGPTDISRLLSEADAAMYVAKRTGASFVAHR